MNFPDRCPIVFLIIVNYRTSNEEDNFDTNVSPYDHTYRALCISVCYSAYNDYNEVIADYHFFGLNGTYSVNPTNVLHYENPPFVFPGMLTSLIDIGPTTNPEILDQGVLITHGK